jgi:hypothetical protein
MQGVSQALRYAGNVFRPDALQMVDSMVSVVVVPFAGTLILGRL